MRRVTDRFRQSGFTLVEMIVSLVVAGALLALVGMFGRWQIQSYFDLATRAELTDAADTALRRITRDLQKALPNSVRVTQVGTTYFLEFVPIADAGRYRADYSTSSDDILDFTKADTSFEVLGPPVSVSSGQQLVVYNLGITAPKGTTNGSDVYEGYNRRGSVSVSGSTVKFSSTSALPFPSPTNHFHIVDGPVTYEFNPAASQIIRHWCYDFQPSQPTSDFSSLSTFGTCAAVQSAVLVGDVSTNTSVTYDSYAALQRNGIVAINLNLQANNETVRLLHQVEVMNTP